MGGTWTPHTPDWVAPSVSQIADEHWLAYSMLMTTRLPWAAGVAAAVAWVRGGRVGPITYRDEQPVTRDLADAECWAAAAARDPFGTLPLNTIYTQLRVTPADPKPGLDVNYSVGAWRALRWLLGIEDQDAPLPVPRRHDDGRVFTGDDVYAEITRGDDSHLSPERRQEIRQYASLQAAQYLHYDGQIRAVQQTLASVS
ncbi:MAG: hypothetical protein ACRDRP_04545 [Pseudonocardiaceae bacterium]